MTSLVSPQADCEEADSGRGRIGVLRTEGVVWEISDSGRARLLEKS